MQSTNMPTKIRRDITLEDISNMKDERFNLSDFNIDEHGFSCHPIQLFILVKRLMNS